MRTSRAAQMSEGASPAGMATVVPPSDSLGAVVERPR